jgi:hypothetical protein
MSQNDENVGLEDQGSENVETEKMVPVSESIRYRKRAQRAEKQAEQLKSDYGKAQNELENLKGQLNELQFDRELTGKLTSAGAIDTEAAMLVAKKRLAQSEDKDVETVIEDLSRDKPYLFKSGTQTGGGTNINRPAKQGVGDNQGLLESAARRASDTGNRVDLQEYLRLRRSLV